MAQGALTTGFVAVVTTITGPGAPRAASTGDTSAIPRATRLKLARNLDLNLLVVINLIANGPKQDQETPSMEKSNAAPRPTFYLLKPLITKGSAANKSIAWTYLVPGKSASRSGFPLASC